MAHPHNEHRAHLVEHRRVGHMLKGYGGHSIGKPHRADHHEDAAEDRKMVKAMVKPSALKHKAHGGGVKHRLDKPHRAKGGRVKHAKTNVNVIVGHGGQQPPMPLPVPPPAPVAAVPRPPMAPPMGGPAMPPPGIPGLGPRKSGGRTYARGGGIKKVKPAAGYAQWKNATPVQHTDGKHAYVHEKRGKPITYKNGGRA